MEKPTMEAVETIGNNEEVINSDTESKEQQDSSPVIKDEKIDTESNSEELNSNDEQNNVNNSGSSQFYESSDSKLDYAVKIDDNDTLSDIDDIKTDTASADSEDSALGSLPPDSTATEREDEVQDRSDGSDSGLGSETLDDSKLPNFNLNLPCTSGLNNETTENPQENDNDDLKENDNSDGNDSDDQPLIQFKKPLKSSLKRKWNEENNEEPQTKRKKGNIRFDDITVYYFPRAQGFSCVPSQGGSTLGMEWEHSHIQKFSLAEHAIEQRRLHRQILQQLKSERNAEGFSLSSSEDSDTEEEASDLSESELDLDSYYFLQPVPTRQRRALLRAAGVRKIEGYEKDECRDIRSSREFCGCACKGVCNPDNCSCSLAGIKCQVDRLSFPCGCTRGGCGNTTGRIEFNPVRVRTHFIHTLMRIGLEKKNEENQAVAKRQWAEHNSNSCSSSSSYDRERCHIQEDGLLRDVSLTPRTEVESCVNAGNFNNVHCDMNNTPPRGNMQEDMSYDYRNANRNINENMMHFDPANNHRNHTDPYTSNILQGKGPHYTGINTMCFDTTSSMQRFPCDLNYTYDHHPEGNHFKSLHSFSASSFEEFAHNSHISMFSHYGHMYAPEYMHKPSTSMHEHNSLHYHAMPQNHYEMYKSTTTECVNNENKSDNHYGNIMSMPYQNSNKMAENDENWFSHSTLMNLDHSEQTQDGSELQPQSATVTTSAPASTTENTENFGELIKKTMVESVTV